MEQVIFGGLYDALAPDTTKYNSLSSGDSWGPSDPGRRQLASTSGKIKNLRVKLNGSPGAGNSYVFTLMLNGNPTALTLEIADAATSNADTTHEVDVVAGDSLSLRCFSDTTPTARYATWTSMFEGATAKESLILGKSGGVSKTTINYAQLFHACASLHFTETQMQGLCPTSGKIKNLYVKLTSDPGTDPDAYRFTLRVNGANSDDGEGNPLQVTIIADDTTGNDTTHEITVAAGDLLSLMVEPLNEPSFGPMPAWGMTFVADTDGESILLAQSEALDPTATEYNSLLSDAFHPWKAAESERYLLGQVCTLKKLYIRLSAPPGDGKSYTFTVRKPGNGQADGNLTVTITGAGTTTGNDTVNEDAIANDDYVDLECTPAGTPDVVTAYWGLVSYIAPPVELENKSANMAAKMMAAGVL